MIHKYILPSLHANVAHVHIYIALSAFTNTTVYNDKVPCYKLEIGNLFFSYASLNTSYLLYFVIKLKVEKV